MVLKEILELPVHTPALRFFPPVHAACPPHLQTSPAALQASTLVLPSQVAAVPHLQAPSEHVSPVIAHVVDAHGSTRATKIILYTTKLLLDYQIFQVYY